MSCHINSNYDSLRSVTIWLDGYLMSTSVVNFPNLNVVCVFSLVWPLVTSLLSVPCLFQLGCGGFTTSWICYDAKANCVLVSCHLDLWRTQCWHGEREMDKLRFKHAYALTHLSAHCCIIVNCLIMKYFNTWWWVMLKMSWKCRSGVIKIAFKAPLTFKCRLLTVLDGFESNESRLHFLIVL